MTKVVVGFITVAIAAFVLNDLFGNGPRSLFSGNNNVVGEIAGKSISLEEFQAAVQSRENNYILNFGRQPGELERPTLRQQAWDLLISRYAIAPQYEKVGVKVTSDEEWDIIQGKNVDENIKLSFTDSAGNFDRNRLIAYLQSLDNQPINSEARVRWNVFRADLVPARERVKFENLIDLHFHQLQQFGVVHQVHLVHENHQGRYPYLACQQDMLPGLGHRAVCGGHHQDGTVHLCGTRNHVLHIVSVARTVNVRIVAVFGSVLNVRGINGNTPFLFLRGVVNRGEVPH